MQGRTPKGNVRNTIGSLIDTPGLFVREACRPGQRSRRGSIPQYGASECCCPRALPHNQTRSAIDAALLVSPHEAKPVAGRCSAEFLGTMILILFGVGVVAQVVTGGFPSTTGATGDYNSIAWGWGLGVTMAVFVAGRLSGAHLNPAVTVALAVFKGLQLGTSPALHRGTDGRGVRRGSAGPLVLLRCHQPSGSRAYEGHPGHLLHLAGHRRLDPPRFWTRSSARRSW